jgi:hypothetical protein
MTDQTSNKPQLSIYTQRYNKDGTTKLGSRIGAGFSHSKGFNIYLDAMPLPVNGKLELVAFTNDQDQE